MNTHSFICHLLHYCLPLLLHSDPLVQRQAGQLLLSTVGNDVFTVLRRWLSNHDRYDIALQALRVLERQSGLPVELRPFAGIHIETLGRFRVYIGNQELTSIQWTQINQNSHSGWQKAQALLGFLLHRGRGGATVEEILEAVWQRRAKANAVVRTFSALRNAIRVLGGEHLADQLVYEQKRFYLLPRYLTVDVDLFVRSVHLAEQVEEQHGIAAAITHYHHAASLYHGNYLVTLLLHDHDIEDYRHTLLSSLLYVVDRLSEYYFTQQQLLQCIEWCRHGIRFDPADEQLTVRLLECYAKQGDNLAIQRTYRRYCRALRDQPDADDEVVRWMQHWY
ncbi:MAG: hypothetical protein KatS3mg055_3039 [Chloroflexus sp.]|uniref:AfsR/SARP family transcriptional regulator n=1 Tax=Chloroflexus sp. TaxID=1904827 RepID=UPI0021DEEA45|nr:bacterial transcriptional activator domain-containing protein [Chloroflexus sp.]GIV90521.1 MAG: hypothetical protein KatS3mg055_3039 [Chloroflexus sp.]